MKMHYEYTTLAIIALLIGICLSVNSIMVGLDGTQWLPFGYPATNIFVELLHEFLNYGLLVGPICIGLGIVGVKHEFEVRDLERKAHAK